MIRIEIIRIIKIFAFIYLNFGAGIVQPAKPAIAAREVISKVPSIPLRSAIESKAAMQIIAVITTFLFIFIMIYPVYRFLFNATPSRYINELTLLLLLIENFMVTSVIGKVAVSVLAGVSISST